MTSHRPYVDAVGSAVQDHGVPIVASVVTRIAGRAEALLRLESCVVSEIVDATHVDLRWDEDRGWRCVVAYRPDTGLVDLVVDGGPEVMESPALVAGWIVAVLARHGWRATTGSAAGDVTAPADVTRSTPVDPAPPAPVDAPVHAFAEAGSPALVGASSEAADVPMVEYAELAA